MKTLIATLLTVASFSAMADTVIANTPLGSGTPGNTGVENASALPDGVYFAPQYLPGYPTAATIWPRVVEVPCEMINGVQTCQGYHWNPKMGRGEYLFFVPVNVPPPPAPVIVTNTVEKMIPCPLPVVPVVPAAPDKKIGE